MLRRSCLIWAAAFAAAVVVAFAMPSSGVAAKREAADAPLSGEIVFARYPRKGHPDLYEAAADGSGVKLLVSNGAEPKVSPDGQSIAFVRHGAIWVMHRDGSRQSEVTAPRVYHDFGDHYSPAWSADGKAIYFSRTVYKNPTAPSYSTIYSIRPNGTLLHRLIKPPKYLDAWVCRGDVAPSPQGRIIGYSESDDCAHGNAGFIAAITKAGKPARLPFHLKEGEGDFIQRSPLFSPDGRLLAYQFFDTALSFESSPSPKIADSGIYISSVDGSRPRRIVACTYCYASGWSSDGWLAFSSQGDIWLVRSDGTGLRRIIRTKAGELDPAWLTPSK